MLLEVFIVRRMSDLGTHKRMVLSKSLQVSGLVPVLHRGGKEHMVIGGEK